MRVWSVVLLLALAGCETMPTEPRDLGKGRFFIEARRVLTALDASKAYCANQGKRFVAGKIERQTRNHWASVTFTCE